MASSPIISWQIDGEKVKTVTDFIFLGSKITVDGDFIHAIKWHLLFGGKAVANLDSNLTLQTKVCIVKGMIFPVVIYAYESWTINKAESQRIDVFEICCWKKLLRIPWKARRSNKSILKEISPEYSLEGLMLKLQYFGPLIQITDFKKRSWCWERLRGGGEEGDRRWDGWMASPIQWIWVWANSGRWWRTGKPGMLQSMGLQRIRHDSVNEQQQCNIWHDGYN